SRLQGPLLAAARHAGVLRRGSAQPFYASAESREPLEQKAEERLRVDPDRDVRVRLAAAPAPQVDDRPAPAELGLAVDLDVEVTRLEEAGLERIREGDRVVDRRAVEVVHLTVKALVEREQIGDHGAHSAARSKLCRVPRR